MRTDEQPTLSPITKAQLDMSPEVIDAFQSAQKALAGDSNDDEHDALWALVEGLDVYNLGKFKAYCPEWIVSDFCGWAGLNPDGTPNQEDIDNYVLEARPANSSPLDVSLVLGEWAKTVAKESPEPSP